MFQPQKYTFWEVTQIKKSTFYTVTLQIEISWAKKIFRPILETWIMPMMLLCMFGLFILELKILKIYNVKNNNAKCTKFTITN